MTHQTMIQIIIIPKQSIKQVKTLKKDVHVKVRIAKMVIVNVILRVWHVEKVAYVKTAKIQILLKQKQLLKQSIVNARAIFVQINIVFAKVTINNVILIVNVNKNVGITKIARTGYYKVLGFFASLPTKFDIRNIKLFKYNSNIKVQSIYSFVLIKYLLMPFIFIFVQLTIISCQKFNKKSAKLINLYYLILDNILQNILKINKYLSQQIIIISSLNLQKRLNYKSNNNKKQQMSQNYQNNGQKPDSDNQKQNQNIQNVTQVTNDLQKNKKIIDRIKGQIQFKSSAKSSANIQEINDSYNNSAKIIQAQLKTVQFASKQDIKQIIEENFPIQQIVKKEISIQVGSSYKFQVLRNIQETYAPQSCEVYQTSLKENLKGNFIKKGNKAQVQIQVGVSHIDQPQKVINKAKQQRILLNLDKFFKFLENAKLLSENQKSVFVHVYESIQKQKTQLLSWNDILKNNFVQYADFIKDFYESAQKEIKQQKTEQLNKFLNLGEQLKEGYSFLVKFRQDSGHNHRVMHQYIYCRTMVDLQKSYKKYAQQMNKAQILVKDKKKFCLKAQEQFKEQASKIKRMFNKIKEGEKDQQRDFFIRISKIIILEKKFRQAITQWGKQIIQLRKSLINNCQIYVNDIQTILNGFKTQQNSLYGIQKMKYDKIRNSRKQMVEQCSFQKLIILVDADYIRYSLQTALKKQIPEITQKIFQIFVQVPHAKNFLPQPKQLLTNLIVKTFALKDTSTQLISTISGNLVIYNLQTLEFSEKISIKCIKDATVIDNGIIQIEQKLPGLIFDSKRKVTIYFKNPDRAEELLCYLGQGQNNDS